MKPASMAWIGAPWTPREWQAEALPILLKALEEGNAPIIWAVMGAGKSIFLTEVCWLSEGVVVVVTPSQDLVNQLHKTISARCESVGRYFAEKKETDTRVIICCYDSLPKLVEELKNKGVAIETLMVDEAHGSEAERVRTAIDAAAARYRFGVTATPWRSDSKERLSIWDDICYTYTLEDAILDEVLVPFQVVNADDEGEIDDVCLEMIDRYRGHSIIINANTIDDGNEFRERLEEHGWDVAFVHSLMPFKERDRLLDEFRDGTKELLLHIATCAEGFDAPIADVLCMRRKVGASVRFSQEVGRVLRANEGKEMAYILDPHDLFARMRIAISPRIGEYEEIEEVETIEGADPLAWLDKKYREEMKKARKEAARPPDKPKHKSKVLGRYKSYLRQLAVTINSTGFSMFEVRYKEKSLPAKDNQILWIKKNAYRLKDIEMPDEDRQALRQVYSVVEWMTRQEAADFRTSLTYIANTGWKDFLKKMVILPPPVEIDQIMLELERLRKDGGNVKRFLKSLPQGLRARLEKSQDVSGICEALP